MAKTMMLAFVSTFIVGAIILQPDASFKASLQGLTIWWNIVFPGLLPFLVLYEIMIAFGLAHALGALLQPATRRLFKLPGEAALVLIMGWIGGYPAGSEATAQLRKRKVVTRSQGQRLLALSHMPNPLLMLVVIGAGFLHKPITGIMIAAAVWLSALWLLLIWSSFSQDRDQASGSNSELTTDLSTAKQGRSSLLIRAAKAFHAGREQDGRSFGKVLGDAVASSVQKLMMIGGFMIFAAVLTKLTELMLAPLFMQNTLSFVIPAFFESHLGAYAVSVWEAPGTATMLRAAVIAAALTWSGLSGILQTSYAVAGTDLKLMPFIVVRILHMLHAFLFMLLLWKPFTSLLGWLLPERIFPVLYPYTETASAIWKASDLPALWQHSINSFIILLCTFIAISLIVWPFRFISKNHNET